MKIQKNDEKIVLTSSNIGRVILALPFILIGLLLLTTGKSEIYRLLLGSAALLPLLVGVAFTFVGATILAATRKQRVILQKNGSNLAHVKNFLGIKSSEINFNTEQISYILLETFLEFGSVHVSPSSVRKHRLSAILKDNGKIELITVVDNAVGLLKQMSSGDTVVSPLSEAATSSASFLGVPLKLSTSKGTTTTIPS